MCDHCAEHKEEKEADLHKLVDLANLLDQKGLIAEANIVDGLIVEAKKKKEKKEKKEDKEDKKEDKKDKKKGKKPFWLQKKKAALIQLADTLDKKGLTAEADELDKLLKEAFLTDEEMDLIMKEEGIHEVGSEPAQQEAFEEDYVPLVNMLQTDEYRPESKEQRERKEEDLKEQEEEIQKGLKKQLFNPPEQLLKPEV